MSISLLRHDLRTLVQDLLWQIGVILLIVIPFQVGVAVKQPRPPSLGMRPAPIRKLVYIVKILYGVNDHVLLAMRPTLQ